MAPPHAFWKAMEALPGAHRLVIDRPAGQPHPRYPDLIYPLDYGYLEGTAAGDGAGVDVWRGSQPAAHLTGILCTIDPGKGDVEIKLLVGCTEEEVRRVLQFNAEHVPSLYLPKP